MVVLLLASLLASSGFAHSVASIPSTKIVESLSPEMVDENDLIVRAIDLDQEVIVREWLKKGHQPTAIVKNKIRESMLDRSATMGSEKVFDVLLSDLENKNTPCTYRDSRGTPILLSLVSMATPGKPSAFRYERMIGRFLSKHAKQINLQDKAYIGDGRTALHQSAVSGNLTVLNSLLSHGAQVNVMNSIGETPLHFAARFGKLSVLKELISRGAKLNETSKHTKVTPLLAAAENGQEAIIRELLDAGAKKELKDAFGKTAPERYREYVSSYFKKTAHHPN